MDYENEQVETTEANTTPTSENWTQNTSDFPEISAEEASALEQYGAEDYIPSLDTDEVITAEEAKMADEYEREDPVERDRWNASIHESSGVENVLDEAANEAFAAAKLEQDKVFEFEGEQEQLEEITADYFEPQTRASSYKKNKNPKWKKSRKYDEESEVLQQSVEQDNTTRQSVAHFDANDMVKLGTLQKRQFYFEKTKIFALEMKFFCDYFLVP
jgi:hypothetical protein